MSGRDKIVTRIDSAFIKSIKKRFKKVVLCQGHFNVIHPGHLRFLEFARSQGDCLLVAVQGNRRILPEVRDKFYDMRERANGVASLSIVDKVVLFDDISITDVIRAVKPHAYVLGEEFSRKTDLIKPEVELVEGFGGKVIFSSGDVSYSSVEFLEKDISNMRHERMHMLKDAIRRHAVSTRKLLEYCAAARKKHILVVGDTIVDQYVGCDAIGMSSEAPVLVVRELEHKEFVGGAAIVARHVRSLGAQCSFISLLGQDHEGEMVKQALRAEKIHARYIIDQGRPTTFKIRYMVGPQKLLRVSRLNEYHINQKMEETVKRNLDAIAGSLDGIIVSDFGYGMITPNVLEYIRQTALKHSIKLFGDVQSSSQIGNVAKFRNYYCLTPTEKEARIALEDKYSGLESLGLNLMKKTNSRNIVLTLGEKGFVSFQGTENEKFVKTQHFPALNPNPVDVVGAGDSLLTALTVASCAGADMMEASVIGATVASIAVGQMGNIPVTVKQLKEQLHQLHT